LLLQLIQMRASAAIKRETYRAELDEHGFAVVPQVVDIAAVNALVSELTKTSAAELTRRGQRYAARNLLSTVPAVATLASAPEIRLLVEPILGNCVVPVRGILFDKVREANWHVAWHQDQIIPVAQRRDLAGFTSWSIKKGVPHVRPPVSILERMLTLRIHLDDCRRDNGALMVIPASHKRGFLTDVQIEHLVANDGAVVCEASRGSVIAMRPLLLHSSAPAMSPSHRRVIHLEFAGEQLPGGLEWPHWDLA
jgi:ectoine hydroxylase-related dioxygenase (phytanoyl-CoA dioxygenase family)